MEEILTWKVKEYEIECKLLKNLNEKLFHFRVMHNENMWIKELKSSEVGLIGLPIDQVEDLFEFWKNNQNVITLIQERDDKLEVYLTFSISLGGFTKKIYKSIICEREIISHDQKLKMLSNRINALESEIDKVKKESKVQKVKFGSTKPGETDWKVYNKYLKLHVDISHLEFEKVPILVATLHGTDAHWTIPGLHIYDISAKSFDIYLHYQGSPEDANFCKWHVHYMATEQD